MRVVETDDDNDVKGLDSITIFYKIKLKQIL